MASQSLPKTASAAGARGAVSRPLLLAALALAGHHEVAACSDATSRAKGVWPLPIYECQQCGKPLRDHELNELVMKRLKLEPSWWSLPVVPSKRIVVGIHAQRRNQIASYFGETSAFHWAQFRDREARRSRMATTSDSRSIRSSCPPANLERSQGSRASVCDEVEVHALCLSDLDCLAQRGELLDECGFDAANHIELAS